MRANGRSVEAPGNRAREDGLRGAGHVLEQDVPAADERREDELDLLRLTAHHRLDVGEEAGPRLRRACQTVAFVRLHQFSISREHRPVR